MRNPGGDEVLTGFGLFGCWGGFCLSFPFAVWFGSLFDECFGEGRYDSLDTLGPGQEGYLGCGEGVEQCALHCAACGISLFILPGDGEDFVEW